MSEPSPRARTNGSPPTPRNARTGELTPPGNSSRARDMISFERFPSLMRSPAEAADRSHDGKRPRTLWRRTRCRRDPDEGRREVDVFHDVVERDVDERPRKNRVRCAGHVGDAVD